MFSKSPGVHSITTKDLNVNDITVVQFEVNICQWHVLNSGNVCPEITIPDHASGNVHLKR